MDPKVWWGPHEEDGMPSKPKIRHVNQCLGVCVGQVDMCVHSTKHTHNLSQTKSSLHMFPYGQTRWAFWSIWAVALFSLIKMQLNFITKTFFSVPGQKKIQMFFCLCGHTDNWHEEEAQNQFHFCSSSIFSISFNLQKKWNLKSLLRRARKWEKIVCRGNCSFKRHTNHS